MINCEITGCEREMDDTQLGKPRTDGILVQVLNTGRLYWICDNCGKKLGLIK